MVSIMPEYRLALVHVEAQGRPSGGNVFNRVLLDAARARGWPLQALSQAPQGPARPCWDLLVWDSLLLAHVARFGHERIGLLLHYLPSAAPGLDPAQAARQRAIEDRAAAVADFCIAVSRELAAEVAARWPKRRCFVCEPGVGEAFRRRAVRAPATPVVLLTVANLLPAKGHAALLDLLAGTRRPCWRWHVVGDDPHGMAPRLQARAQALGVGDRVVLHGALPQPQVAARMASADLLLHPSAFESYGMVLAEAAAVGLPAVAFRVGAAERLVAHGETGFVPPPGDWEAFGRHLAALLDDPGLRMRFERNLAARPVRRWDRTLDEFRAACETML